MFVDKICLLDHSDKFNLIIRIIYTCGKLYADYKTHALGNILETYRLGEKVEIPDLEIVIGSCQNATI